MEKETYHSREDEKDADKLVELFIGESIRALNKALEGLSSNALLHIRPSVRAKFMGQIESQLAYQANRVKYLTNHKTNGGA